MGIPGLIHAYGAAAEDAIENATLKPWMEKKLLFITYPYEYDGVMQSILKKNDLEVIHVDFGEKIDIKLEINENTVNEFIDNIKELSAGSAQIIIGE